MRSLFFALAMALTGLPSPSSAQFLPPATAIVRPPLPAIGSRDAVIDVAPLVARPTSRSCVVELFARREFLGEAAHPIAFVPPTDCPGPWARIVIENAFDVTAGRQYDRSARLTIAGINLYTGTTMEPREGFAPRWSVERDVTDYAAIFTRPAAGEAVLQNFTDAQHVSQIAWGSRLVFYQADDANPAAVTADIVTPLADRTAQLSKSQPSVERTVTWPRNVERMVIDVLVMPQRSDEMWQRCVPEAALPAEARDGEPCGMPFRESEVRIDGTLAGLAPVFPWIYTGGMGAWNWTVVPGIGALDLRPYRVDLTPFAAVMNDGRPHRIELTARGAQDYMAATATLLAWRDAGKAVVTGAVTRNTLRPTVLALKGSFLGAKAGGALEVMARRAGGATGYVDGSRGRVTTRIDYTMRFSSRLRVHDMHDDVQQTTELDTRTVTDGDGGTRRARVIERFPLSWGWAIDPASTRRGVADLDQELFRDETITDVGRTIRRVTRQTVSPREQPTAEKSWFPSLVESTASIRVSDSHAGCYDRTVVVLAREVVNAVDRCR